MERRPKLALICTEMLPVPPVRGGAIQTYIAGVIPHLVPYFEITVVSVADDSLPVRETLNGVRFVRLAQRGAKQDYYEQAAAFIATEQWDVIELFNRPTYVKLISNAAPGVPVVLSMHNEMFGEKKIDAAHARECLEATAAVIGISRFIARGVRTLYPEFSAKVTWIRSGVELKTFRPLWLMNKREAAAIARRVPSHNRRPLILAVARMSNKKGVHIVIEAMTEVLKKHPTARLSIVGSRWYGENTPHEYVTLCEELAKPFGDAITFSGYVSYKDIPDYFATADMFVCASQWHEPLARVHYEAMASGLPIITTKRGGNAEVMEEGYNGLLIKKHKEPAECAAAINHLLDQPEKAAVMGRYGRLLAEKHYSWKRVAKDLREVLLSVKMGECRLSTPSFRNSIERWDSPDDYSSEYPTINLPGGPTPPA